MVHELQEQPERRVFLQLRCGVLPEVSAQGAHAPIDSRLKEVIGETCVDARSELIEMEVMADHVHLLLDCDPQFGINRLVRSIKGRSSRLLRSEFPTLKSRLPSLWPNSYLCASVGGALLSVIKQSIENQKGV